MAILDQLLVLATLALTLVGFTAFFIALTTRGDGKFDKGDRQLIRAFILTSILAMIYSLLPSVISWFSPEDYLTYSVIVGLIGGLVPTFYGVHDQFFTGRSEEDAPALAILPTWVLATASFCFGVLSLVYPDLKEGYYLAAALSMLALATWCFVVVVFRRFF